MKTRASIYLEASLPRPRAVWQMLLRSGNSTPIAFLILALLFASSCQDRKQTTRSGIEFTKIPPAAEGGRERVDTIAGRVSGARPGQKIVVYAKSGPWWVQPWPEQALIEINANGTWSTPTHLGYEYSALLVNPDYHPSPTLDEAPTEGGSVIKVKIVQGVGSLPPALTKPLQFSGYDWNVRTVAADRGGVNNLYDGDNAWTDASGALHMRITKKEGRWHCAEVVLGQSLGYGTYRVVVRDTSRLEPAAVLSMHTFDESGGSRHYREMDVEIGRWGNAESENNAQYGIQPFYVPGNVVPFVEPAGTLTHTFRWESGKVSFETVRGASARTGGPVVSRHVFTSGVPTPGAEVFQFMLYVVASDGSPLQKEIEVVVEKFEYFP